MMRGFGVRAVSAVAGVASLMTVGAAPAHAVTYGWVYMSMPGWLGNCPNSTVYGIQADVSGVWSTNWDYGDDLVYGKVKLGENNTLNYNLMCRVGNRPVGFQAYTVTIRPTRNNQTVWSGPGGVRYN